MHARAVLLALAIATAGAGVAAQEPPPVPQRTPGRGFLANYEFHVGLEALSGDDPRLQWDFDAGGDIDVLRTEGGRVNLLVNYEGLLGEVLQKFDPIFNNYT